MTEQRSFLGFASSYCRLIKGFTKIAGPLHDPVNESRKSAKKKTASMSLLWGPIHQSIRVHETGLDNCPVLGYADYTKPFILETDASHDGLNAILSQEQDGKQRVIAYAS